MKKLLLFLAAVSCMMMANAQIKLSYNDTEYSAGETIQMTINEADIVEMDNVFMGTVNVINTTNATMIGVTVGAAIDAPGYAVSSVCGPAGCVEGDLSKPFDLNPNEPIMVFVEFHINAAELNADKKGTATVSVNVGDQSYVFYFEMTYVPSNNGIEGIEMNNVKVWPNPVVSEITIACENVSEVVIMDVAGRVMERVAVKGANEIKVDMSNYSDGVYLCGTVIDGVLKGVSRVVKY